MENRSLHYVLAIAEHQNLTKAAESLYIGQPTLSKFLSSLEQELGLKLFSRLGNRYVLTYAGERYVTRARQILQLEADLKAEMADIVRNDRGVLRAAFAPMRCSYLLPVVLPAFRRKYPNVRITVLEGNSAENDRRLLAGEADVIFYTKSAETNPLLTYHTLGKEELLLCTSQGHPLGRYARPAPDGGYPLIDLDHLKDELVLLLRPTQRTRQIVDDVLREQKLTLPNTLVTSNMMAIMGMVSKGYGVSFLLDSHLRHLTSDLKIDCYRFGSHPIVNHFVAATRKGSYLSRYAEAFIEIVRDEWEYTSQK